MSLCYRKRYSPRVWQIPTKNIIYFHVGFTERFSIIIKMVFFCFCFYFLFFVFCFFFALSACFGGCMGSADAGPGHEWLSVSLPHSSWPSPEDWGYCFGVRLTLIPPILLFCTDVTDWSLKITCGPSFKCGMERQKKRYGVFILYLFHSYFCCYVHLTRSISHVPLLCTLWENRLKSVVCSNAINA